MRRRRLLVVAVLGAAALSVAPASPASADTRLPSKVRAIGSVVAQLQRKVELMELSADRYADWQTCIHGVPVSEYGDKDRQFGYRYDEVDGIRPAADRCGAPWRISSGGCGA